MHRSASSSTRRLVWLDSLRGLAAGVVVLAHVLQVAAPGDARDIPEFLGQLGVVVFFLISGYIIPRSIEHQGTRVFFLRRVCRLFPLYLASLVAVVLLGAAGLLPETLHVPDAHPPLATIGVNVLMLAALVGAPSILSVYWTLAVEWCLYVLVALFPAWRRAPASCAIVLAVIAAGVDIVAASRGLRPPLPVATYLAIMALGTIAARWDAGSIERRDHLKIIGAIGVVAVVALLPGAPMHNTAMALARLVGAIVFVLALRIGDLGRWGWWPWLGAISYSLYLVHPIVIALASPLPSILCGVVSLIGSIAVAVVTERWIERPSIALGRRVRSRCVDVPSMRALS